MRGRTLCGVGLAVIVAAVLASSAPGGIVESQITLSSAAGVPERGDSGLAIDGSTDTSTYTTPSFNSQDPSYLEVFFSDTESVNRFRIYKGEYLGTQDWALQYTTDGSGWT